MQRSVKASKMRLDLNRKTCTEHVGRKRVCDTAAFEKRHAKYKKTLSSTPSDEPLYELGSDAALTNASDTYHTKKGSVIFIATEYGKKSEPDASSKL